MTETVHKIELPYGDEFKTLEIPKANLAYILEPGEVPALEDEGAEVKRSLENPIGCKRIKDSVKPGDKIIILGDDLSRPTPCYKLLPPILDELNMAGVKDENITIIVSLGTHRPLTEEEFKIKFGTEVAERIRIINHNWENEDNLVDMGVTDQGTPITVNKEYYDADYKIGLGGIIPHPFGWGGGGKIVEPGICGAKTTFKIHRLGASFKVMDLIGNVDNPVRKEIDAITVESGLDFIVNAVIDAEGKLVGVFSGDVLKAHREGVRFAEKVYRPSVIQRVEIMVAGSNAYGVNIDYWQAIKGTLAASCAVKKGGTIILATPCYEGIPTRDHPEVTSLGTLRYKEAMAKIDEGAFKDPSLPGFVAINAQLKEWANIIIVSDHLTKEMCDILGLDKADSVQEALDTALRKHGSDAKIGILKHFEVFAKAPKN